MDPITLALVGVASGVLGNLAQSLVTDVAKHEFYAQLERAAKTSTIAGTLHRMFNGPKKDDEAVPEVPQAQPQLQVASAPPVRLAGEAVAFVEAAGQMDIAVERAVLEDIVREVTAQAESVEGADRATLHTLAESLDGLSRMLEWFSQSEQQRRLEATHWLDAKGAFRPWTAKPWFEDFDYITPWGRFLLLGLAATWNFPKSFEEGETFMLLLAERYRPTVVKGEISPALRAALGQFAAHASACRAQGLPGPAMTEALQRKANELALLRDGDVPALRRGVRLVELLENVDQQAHLPAGVVEAINRGQLRRLSQIEAYPDAGLQALLPQSADGAPTLYLDFFLGLAAIAEHFEAIDAFLQPQSRLTPERIGQLVTRLKAMRAPYLTRGGKMSSVIKVKLPLLLRELRGKGIVEVDPCFCSTPDSHVRRSLQRLHPRYFTSTDGYPGLSREGVKFVERQLAARFGVGALASLEEPTVASSYYEVVLVSSLVYFSAPGEPFLYDIPWFLSDMAGEHKGSVEAKVPRATASKKAGKTLLESIDEAVETGALPRFWTTQHLLAVPAIAENFNASTVKTDPSNRSASPCGTETGFTVKAQPQSAPYLRFSPRDDKRLWFCLRSHYRAGQDPATYLVQLADLQMAAHV